MTNSESGVLTPIREEISAIDQQILLLIAKRMDCSLKVAKTKQKLGIGVKDYAVEKQILERQRNLAATLNINPTLSDQIFKALIEHSCQLQDESIKSVAPMAKTPQSRVLVVGGNGQMGQWFCHFFESLGYKVSVFDPHMPHNPRFECVADLKSAVANQELTLLATPISETARIIELLAATPNQSIVIDICSLKSPITDSLLLAAKNGLCVASIHPMFGAKIKSLVGRNIVICEHDAFRGTSQIESILKKSSANLIKVPFDTHDERMSFVLGSAHFLNIAFAHMLATGPFHASQLIELAGTTFKEQLRVTREVAYENQDLYFEIQALNHQTPKRIKHLEESIRSLSKSIHGGDRKAFKEIFELGRTFFEAVSL